MVRFGLISAYPEEDWHSQRLARACAARGQVDVVSPAAFSMRVSRGVAPTILAAGRDVRECDVWLTPRALGDQGNHGFQCGAYRAIAELGVPMVNPVDALLVALDKVRCSWLFSRTGVPTPPAIAVQNPEEAMHALAALRTAVAKPPCGSLGIGIIKLSSSEERALRCLRRMLRKYGVIYLQKWTRPRGRMQDLRLFVVGDRVAGAIARRAAAHEFRTNIFQGGRALRLGRHTELERLAVNATRAVGLEYSGVDILETDDGPTVLEVNGTPNWAGILDATGCDMAEEIAAHAAALATGSQKKENAWTEPRAN